MRKFLIAFLFLFGCFVGEAFSQCRLPMIPPATTTVGRAMVWTRGAPEFNIQTGPDFTLKRENDSWNDLEIVRREIKYKGVSFSPPARIGAPVNVYQGFFNENEMFGGDRRWVVVVPVAPKIGRLLLLNLGSCTSKFVSITPKEIGRLVWKNENNFWVCDSNRSSYTQINALSGAIKPGTASPKSNPCGYYLDEAGTVPIPIRVGDRWGFSDSKKRVLLDAKYDSASPFTEGLAAVTKGKKCGYVDKKGVEIIALVFDTCYGFADGAAKVLRSWDGGTSWMLIDQKGKLLDTVSNAQQDFSDGMSIQLWGKYAKNPNGTAVVTLKDYAFEWNYSEGLACVRANDWSNHPGNGFVDKTGRLVFWSPYNCRDGFYSGLASMRTKDPVRYGFIDKKGKVVIPLKYMNSLPFTGDFAVVQDQKEWMTIDRKGVKIASLDFDGIGFPNGGLIPVSKNKRWGFVDKTGKVIIPLKYDNTQFFRGLPYAYLNGKSFVVGKDGTEFYTP